MSVLHEQSFPDEYSYEVCDGIGTILLGLRPVAITEASGEVLYLSLILLDSYSKNNKCGIGIPEAACLLSECLQETSSGFLDSFIATSLQKMLLHSPDEGFSAIVRRLVIVVQIHMLLLSIQNESERETIDDFVSPTIRESITLLDKNIAKLASALVK